MRSIQVKRMLELSIFFTMIFMSIVSRSTSESCSELVPRNYNRNQPPSNESRVGLTFSVESIDRVNVASRTFRVQIEVYLVWNDDRLYQQDSHLTEYYGQFVSRSNIHCFWIPEITIEGLLTSSLTDNPLKKPRLRIGENKGVTQRALFSMESFNLEVRCKMQFTWYPMDTQLCQITFSTFKSAKTNLYWFRKIYNDSQNLDTSYSVHSITQLPPRMSPHGSDKLIIEFKFARRPVVALITIFFPSALIVAVSFVSFWIDPQSVPGRISLIVTSLLALMTQLVSVRNTIPDVSYITALDVWFFASITFVASALFEFAVSYTQSNRKNNVLTPVIYNRLYDRAKVRSMAEKTGEGKVDPFSMTGRERVMTDVMLKFRERIAKASALDLDILSRYAFPLSFTLFCAVYWTGFIVAKDN